MVDNASVSGLNDCVWVPRFGLPTVSTHLRAVEAGTFMANLDVEEMFLNFTLHNQLQALCGVDLPHFSCKHQGYDRQRVWEVVWKRAAMGLRSLPYQALQWLTVSEEPMLGNRMDITNVFCWDRVRLNLPGSKGYNSGILWV